MRSTRPLEFIKLEKQLTIFQTNQVVHFLHDACLGVLHLTSTCYINYLG